jgi:hypothetical protein
VIIQDLETKAYLSESVRWVLNKADARDFETLLRAYLFAEKNTSCKFEVLLHCLDDGYTSGIIKGVGTAIEKIPAVVESDATETVWASRNVSGKSAGRFNLDFINTANNHLN